VQSHYSKRHINERTFNAAKKFNFNVKNIKPILIIAVPTLLLNIIGCTTKDYSKPHQFIELTAFYNNEKLNYFYWDKQKYHSFYKYEDDELCLSAINKLADKKNWEMIVNVNAFEDKPRANKIIIRCMKIKERDKQCFESAQKSFLRPDLYSDKVISVLIIEAEQYCRPTMQVGKSIEINL
jgi:hypothetical protein